MSKLNWERIALENRITTNGSEPAQDWIEEKPEKSVRKRLPSGMTRCSLCKAILLSKNLPRHDKKVHGIGNRQALTDAGVLPVNKNRLKHGRWSAPSGTEFRELFVVEIVADDPTWERQRNVAYQIDSIVPRIMLVHKPRGIVKKSIRWSVVCYSQEPLPLQTAQAIIDELATLAALNLTFDAKKPTSGSDLLIYL